MSEAFWGFPSCFQVLLAKLISISNVRSVWPFLNQSGWLPAILMASNKKLWMKIKSRSNPDATLGSWNCLLVFTDFAEPSVVFGRGIPKETNGMIHLSNKQKMAYVCVPGQFISFLSITYKNIFCYKLRLISLSAFFKSSEHNWFYLTFTSVENIHLTQQWI